MLQDLVLTEVVDEAHRPVPPGEYGVKVLVTVLFSRTLPLIRYEMSDSVQLATQHSCTCGRPYALITGIQGRQQEALQLPARAGGLQTVQPIVFHHVMDPIRTAGWQIVQRPDRLEVLLAQPHDVDTNALLISMRDTLTSQGVMPRRYRSGRSAPSREPPFGKAPLITKIDSQPGRS